MTCVCERECYTYPLQQYFFPAAHVHFVVLKDWRPSLCIMATQKIEIPLAGINLKVFYKMLLKSKTKGVQKIPPPKNVDLGHVMILLLLFYLYTFVDVTASEYFSLSRASHREIFLSLLLCVLLPPKATPNNCVAISKAIDVRSFVWFCCCYFRTECKCSSSIRRCLFICSNTQHDII